MSRAIVRKSNNPTGINQYSNSEGLPKDDNISIRLPSGLKAKFQASADAEGISLTSWCLEKMSASL